MTAIKQTIVSFILFTALLLASCSDNAAESPETRLQNWVAQMETAVKEKKLSDIKPLISPDYQDAQGNTRQKIMLQLAMWFKRYDNIGLDNTITEIKVMGEIARMVIETKFSESQAFAQMGLSRNTYQFVLLMEEKGDTWLVNSVSYQRKDIVR